MWAGNTVQGTLPSEGINLQNGVYSMEHSRNLCVFMCLAKCLEK